MSSRKFRYLVAMSDREMATILAALANWLHEEPEGERMESDTATDNGTVTPLNDQEIIGLIERLKA